MKIGFLSNCFAKSDISDLISMADWAAENGFGALEIGPSIPLDEKKFDQVLSKGKITFSAFIYCRNFLSSNAEEAATHKNALLDRIRFAKKAGIKNIICSTGVKESSFSTSNPTQFIPEASLDDMAELFKMFIEEAEKNDVRLAFELCPSMSNIAFSPHMWDQIFDRVKSDRLGLCFDPSHLVWMFIDSYKVLSEYRNKIFHVHGKDTEVNYDALGRSGILQIVTQEKTSLNLPHGNNKHLWWRHRLPGLGQLDWGKIISQLYEYDYSGVISIEHEDPVWSGSPEKIKAGLLRSKKYLEQYL
ncbi:MAG: sugar phosphate isomerase/epimerase [Treponema sp.]|nr:sugar phosphate isomerase/epimerase [Treponema sp.]